MAKGSQLTQLKSALAQAGLTGKPSTNKKRKRSAVPLEKEKEKQAARLEEIHRRLNPFDTKVTKTKHDVGGRKLKGVTGRPAQSKQAGIERRKKTLLKEWEERNRAGGIVDRRFGENDPTMSIEERMLERFTRERQRASKNVAFNLEDEDELTHYGQSLSKLDDFDDVGIGLDSDQDEETGELDKDIVSRTHFGGFDEEDKEGNGNDDEESAKKKSKAEVMAEVIAKSKEHKVRRQIEKEQEENFRHELDNDFTSLRDLLYASDPSLTRNNDHDDSLSVADAAMLLQIPEAQDADYDHHVRELAFDKRSQPKDRTKTEEELALEEEEALKTAEKQRQKRMLGLEGSDDDDTVKTNGKRKRGGDDLEDDFNDNEGMEWGGLGAGLDEEVGDGDEYNEQENNEEESGTGEEDDYQSYDDHTSKSEDEEGEQEGLATSGLTGKAFSIIPSSELPFTFPAPVNHRDFLEILEGVQDKDIPVVIQRIRTLYHTSLAPENKQKLQTLANVLIDHILYVSAPPTPRFSVVSSILPHLNVIIKAYPIPAAQFFNEKLNLMHKNLKQGLSHGSTNPKAKTWPGPSELSLLRVIGMIWPTSDLNHAVISPARVLMGAYLGLCRYESLSKRFVPEAINFLINALLHLSPSKYKDAASLPGHFPAPDFRSELCQRLVLTAQRLTPKPSRANLPYLLTLEKPTEQAKVNLLALTLDLLEKFVEMYKGLDGFIELCGPILDILRHIRTDNWDEELLLRHSRVLDIFARLLKFAKQSRQPLALQAHKPIPIPSYIPKFEATTSNYLRKKDQDYEKNEAAKLRYQLKQERKGAIRELRKDARFLAAVEQKKQLEKDRDYNARIKRAFTSIESERAEQKAMEREKTREKRRSGRK